MKNVMRLLMLLLLSFFCFLGKGQAVSAKPIMDGKSASEVGFLPGQNPDGTTIGMFGVAEFSFVGTPSANGIAMVEGSSVVGDASHAGTRTIISDLSGSGTGWKLGLKLSRPFSNGKQTPKGVIFKLGSGKLIPVLDTNQEAYPVASPKELNVSDNIIVEAGANQGMGKWEITFPQATLVLPLVSQIGDYNAELTWTLSTTP